MEIFSFYFAEMKQNIQGLVGHPFCDGKIILLPKFDKNRQGFLLLTAKLNLYSYLLPTVNILAETI